MHNRSREAEWASAPVSGDREDHNPAQATVLHMPDRTLTLTRGALLRALAIPPRWISYWSQHALRRAKAIRRPRILMYHVIGDGDVSRRQFEWQLAFLRKHFEPVKLSDLVDRMQFGGTTGREVVITFDDGVRNHFNVVWPLLRAYGVPATFFVCPGLISSGTWIWRTELRMRLGTLDARDRKAIAETVGCPDARIEPMMQWAKALEMNHRQTLQREVEMRTRHFSPSPQASDDNAPLSWEQIRQMDEQLITIGSHTNTHPMLPTLTARQLQEEIAGSRLALEQHLDRTVDLFSYPNGANSPAVVEMVRSHYRAAVIARQDIVSISDDPMMLPRVPSDGARATFVRRLHRPSA